MIVAGKKGNISPEMVKLTRLAPERGEWNREWCRKFASVKLLSFPLPRDCTGQVDML